MGHGDWYSTGVRQAAQVTREDAIKAPVWRRVAFLWPRPPAHVFWTTPKRYRRALCGYCPDSFDSLTDKGTERHCVRCQQIVDKAREKAHG